MLIRFENIRYIRLALHVVRPETFVSQLVYLYGNFVLCRRQLFGMKSCKSVDSSFAVSACNNGRTTEWISIKSDIGKFYKKMSNFSNLGKTAIKKIQFYGKTFCIPAPILSLARKTFMRKKNSNSICREKCDTCVLFKIFPE